MTIMLRRDLGRFLYLVASVGLASGASAQTYFATFSGASGSVTCSTTSVSATPGLILSWSLPSSTSVRQLAKAGSTTVEDTTDAIPTPTGSTSIDGTLTFASTPLPYTFVYSVTPQTPGAGTSSFSFDCVVVSGLPTPSNFRISNAPPFGPGVSATIGPGFTGVWNDPKQDRHGIFVEILPPNIFLAWWFTFTPDGTQQSWFGGTGTYSGNTATVPVKLTTGGQWIPNFDVSKTHDIPWGTLTFTFTSCNSGRVDFVSTYPGYGSNHMDLTRVTLPSGLTCP